MRNQHPLQEHENTPASSKHLLFLWPESSGYLFCKYVLMWDGILIYFPFLFLKFLIMPRITQFILANASVSLSSLLLWFLKYVYIYIYMYIHIYYFSRGADKNRESVRFLSLVQIKTWPCSNIFRSKEDQILKRIV